MALLPLSRLIEYIGVVNLLTAVTLTLVVVWFLRKNWASVSNLPPGPPAIPYPFDVLVALLPIKDRFGQVLNISKRYGDLASLRIGDKIMVVIASPSLVKDLIVKQGDVTSNREAPPFFSYIMDYSSGIIFSQGESWQELRRFTLSALRNFGMGKKSIENRIAEEARLLCGALTNLSGKPFDPLALLNAAVSNIICAITFGKRFDYDDAVLKDMIFRMRKLTSGGGIHPFIIEIMIRFPVLLKSPLMRRSQENLLGVKDFINKQVNDHSATFDPRDVRDILDLYLGEVRRMETGEVKPYLTEDTLWMCVFDLFLAGTETTATSLLWFVLLMCGNPDIQQRVHDEIDQVIGRERAPSSEDRKNMPYTDATLIEVMRYRPAVPMGVPHVTATEVKVRGYTIPKDTEILISILGIHLDPEFWDNPEEFNPKRFLNEEETSVIKHDAFTVFGAGRRVCLGEQLARMEFFMFATSLLQRFKFRLPEGDTPDYSFDHCIGLLTPKNFNVIADDR